MCRRVQGSQIFKQNWIILIRSRVIVILPIWVSSALGVGQVGGGVSGWSAIVYMSSGMFRGKESLNRIKLSRLVQDLLNFGVLASLRLSGLGGGFGWGWEVFGRCPPHTYTCMCTHACTHTYTCVVNMIISCKWLPPMGESLGIPYDVICACACMHVLVCAHVCGVPSHHPHPHPPTPHPPEGDQWNQSKFNRTWTNWDISILFEDLKSLETSPLMSGCMVWWVGGLMDGVTSKH